MSLVLTNSFRYGGASPPGPPGGLGIWQAEVAGVGSTDFAPAYLDPLGPFEDADVDIFVDPDAVTNGTGTSGSPYDNIQDALAAVADGQTIGVRGGTLDIASRLIRSATWATGIKVVAIGAERFTLNFTGAGTGDAARVLTLTGSGETWHGLDITGWNTGGAGVYIDGDDYHLSAVKATHGVGDGIYFYQGTGCTLRDIAVFRIGDGTTSGTNAPDAIALTGSTSVLTTDIEMARIFIANGPDDGLDLFRARGVRVWNVVTYDCGRYWNGATGGDGNGLKLGGGDSNAGDNHVVGVLTIDNAANGVTHNEAANTSGTDPNIVAAFVTAYGNGGIGGDLGGDQTNHKNVLRDAILTGNATDRYVGANAIERRTTSTLSIATPGFVNTTDDFSLDAGSACIGEGIQEGITNSVATQPTTGTSDNLGASITCLRMWKYWSAQDLT